jgi:hypothetical protein
VKCSVYQNIRCIQENHVTIGSETNLFALFLVITKCHNKYRPRTEKRITPIFLISSRKGRFEEPLFKNEIITHVHPWVTSMIHKRCRWRWLKEFRNGKLGICSSKSCLPDFQVSDADTSLECSCFWRYTKFRCDHFCPRERLLESEKGNKKTTTPDHHFTRVESLNSHPFYFSSLL